MNLVDHCERRKSAFDCVDRTVRHFRIKGIPDIILHLITALRENTSARIRVGQKLSPRISTPGFAA